MNKKITIFDVEGKKAKEIEIPGFFITPVREDLIGKILEAKKTMQPYSPSLMAGKQYAASGKLVHRRHVWRSGYGRGNSRIPRKMMSRRGSQFVWVGAEISSTRGGRRAHPPKTVAMINTKKINKKELSLALAGSLSATADKKYVSKRYKRIDEKDLKDLPLIVESKILTLGTKEILETMKKILGKGIFEVVIRQKRIRKGKGKQRGRRYKTNQGILIVLGNKEKIKTKTFSTKTAENLGITDLAEGGPGRITIYTEQALADLQTKFNNHKGK